MPLPPSGSDFDSWIALASISSLGGESVRKLLKAFGSPSAVLQADEASLAGIVGRARANAIVTNDSRPAVERATKWLAGQSNHLITLADADYPSLLLEIVDPPPLLYARGRRAMLGNMCIAVVGSRNATPVGCQNAENFSRTLSQQGITIVSGLALGIDASAHRGGLAARGSTIAVVGTGLDLIYPARNKPIAQEIVEHGLMLSEFALGTPALAIVEHGLMLSEFALGTPALAANFPRRNRIISGLARGVLVVEAALQSGSLITARQALEQGRDVFAIPGSIHSALSKGTHSLIKQGAKLVDDANDILDELGIEADASLRDHIAPVHATAQTTEQQALLDAIGFEPISLDELCSRMMRQANELAATLTTLEIDGVIVQVAGGKYQRLAAA
jgi:DNA processing protein